MQLSIIVPVLNERELIGPFLHHLRRTMPAAELVVVDGGSDDGTIAIAEGIANRVLRSAPGRGRQMNTGAHVASGDTFWFLHADSQVQQNCCVQIERALDRPGQAGGCFRLRIPRRAWIYRVSDSLGNCGVVLFAFALGDHGIFCRRDDFFAVGGYPDIPLMEDAEFYQRLRKRGRMSQLSATIQTSPRRYEQHGPCRTTAFYLFILALYVLRAPISVLATVHRRFTGTARSRPISAEQPLLHPASSTST